MKTDKKSLLETLKKNKIRKKILNVIEETQREQFFDPIFRDRLYKLDPLPIGYNEKSDNILILAKMIQLLDLNKKKRVLEIGTGTGYSTAILASMASELVTIEYHEELAISARDRLKKSGFNNIKFYSGDGTDNHVDLGFFDAMIVLCGCSSTPYPIINLLNDEGSAVFPMGPPAQQQIILFKNRFSDGKDPQSSVAFHDFCEFNSIRGRYGWLETHDFYPEYNSKVERGKLENPGDQSGDPESSL